MQSAECLVRKLTGRSTRAAASAERRFRELAVATRSSEASVATGFCILPACTEQVGASVV